MDTVRSYGTVPAFAASLGVPEDDLGGLCKALGHPVRVRIVSILLEMGGCNAGELVEEFALAASTVSEHLRILREAGLIDATAFGAKRSYRVNTQRLAHLKLLINALASI